MGRDVVGLDNKFLNKKTLSQVQAKPIDYSFWKGLMHFSDDIFNGVFLIVRDGKSTRFWKDIARGVPLAQQYLSIYNILQHTIIFIVDVLSQTPPNIRFRRGLTSSKCI
jgi:hypothetical protein